MRKKYLLQLLFLLSFSSYGQAPIIEWQKCFGGTNDDQAQSIQQTTDGGYIVANLVTSNDGEVTNFHGGTGGDIWVVKLDSTGTIEWQKTLGGTNSEGAFTVKQTIDGGYIICGYTTSNNGDVTNNHGGYDCWVVKLSNNGTIEWQKTYGGAANDGFWSRIQQTADNGYIICADTRSTNGDVTSNHGGADIWVVKITNLGAIEWQKTYGGTSDEFSKSIQQTSDGGYIVLGDAYSTDGDVTGNHGSSDVWVVKINNVGDIQWQKTYGSVGAENAYCISKTNDNGYIISAFSPLNNGDVSGNHGGGDIWIVKLNDSGTLQWQKCIGGTGVEYSGVEGIQQTSDGNYIVVGQTTSNNGDASGNHGGYDCWLIKLGPSGSVLWQKPLGGTGEDRAYAVQQTSDDGYIVTGLTNSTDGDVSGCHGSYDFWVVKLGPDTLSTNDFSEESISLYPNPSIDIIYISTAYSFSESNVRLFDTIGKTMAIHFENNSINISSLASGIYYLELKNEYNKTVCKKIIKQ